MITRKRFAEAASELEEFLKLNAEKGATSKLAELCRKAQLEKTGSPAETASLLAFAEAFTQTQDHALADGVLGGLGLGKTALETRKRLLEMYSKRVEAAWPGQASNLRMSTEGRFSLALGTGAQVRDLTPLRGIPLTSLTLASQAQIRDLMPLKDMPLTSLNLANCTQIRDLEPLKGMPLTSLDLNFCALVSNLEPLRGMKLTKLGLHSAPVQDLEPLRGMPLTLLDLDGVPIRDLDPLKGMPLASLVLAFHKGNAQVRNLEPLRGMALTSLSLQHCGQVRDLEPLKGMKLTSLNLCGTQVRDLEPLKGMPLKNLLINDSGVTDLKPLQAMQLEDIRLTSKNITQGLDILRDMKSLKTIGIHWNQGWPAAEFWDRHEMGEFKK